MSGESTYARTAEPANMPAAESTDVTTPEPASVTTPEPGAVASSAMLRPERDSQEEDERRNGGPATHTQIV